MAVRFGSFIRPITYLNGGTSNEKEIRFIIGVDIGLCSPAGDWPLAFLSFELAKRFNARVSEYQIEVYAGGALAKLPEYFDAVRIGAVEMSCAPWAMFSNLDPRLGVIETPFLFVSSRAASSASMDLLPLYDQLLQKNFHKTDKNPRRLEWSAYGCPEPLCGRFGQNSGCLAGYRHVDGNL